MQYSAIHNNAIQDNIILYYTMLYSATWYNTVVSDKSFYSILWSLVAAIHLLFYRDYYKSDCIILSHIVSRYDILCCIVLYCIVLYCIVLYCIVLHRARSYSAVLNGQMFWRTKPSGHTLLYSTLLYYTLF